MSDEFKFLGFSIPNFAILCGGILVLTGIAAYAISDTDSWTALIPSFFGTPLVILGLLSNKNSENSHHYMHASMVFALISVLGGLRIFSIWGEASNLTLISHFQLLFIGGIFMFSGILSFRHIRKLRESLGE
jgi:hypothetical protein|tara:strand:+ start:2452 stop:2847 length:396 start_codon:yes stop_codon:yes gene_type:complete